MSAETRSVRSVVSVLSMLAGVVGVGVAAAAWKEMGGLDPAIAKRVVAISIGAAMMIAGNALQSSCRHTVRDGTASAG